MVNNNNLPSVVPETRIQEDRVYADLTPTLEVREIAFSREIASEKPLVQRKTVQSSTKKLTEVKKQWQKL